MNAPHQQTGQLGEALARDYLLRAGYHLQTANWRCPEGEIDIVASKDGTLVFVEVRCRRAISTETAFASIAPSKQQRMLSAAYAYLSANHLPEDTVWRIDVIAVALQHAGPPVIEHVENALDW